MRRLIIYAPNVASSGGIVLLRALIKALPKRQAVTLILDVRAREHLLKATEPFVTHWFHSDVQGRLRAEVCVKRLSKPGSVVFCFHNLPPILPSPARVICYLHNANLVGLVPKIESHRWLKLRYCLERSIATIRKFAVERYVVQTITMKEAVESWFGASPPPVDVLPFIDEKYAAAGSGSTSDNSSAINCDATKWDFIYVSDGSPHKNHPRLFQAWALLANEGFYPTLAITVDPRRSSQLVALLKQIVDATGAKIENLGQIPHRKVLDLYDHSGALIFPSIAESFGIPLLEAHARHLPILAPELDYVRDVCIPAETFDPNSSRSIARAVKRFLKGPCAVKPPMSADEFLAELVRRL